MSDFITKEYLGGFSHRYADKHKLGINANVNFEMNRLRKEHQGFFTRLFTYDLHSMLETVVISEKQTLCFFEERKAELSPVSQHFTIVFV